MKKRFFQLHIVYIFLMLLIFLFALIGLYSLYLGIVEKNVFLIFFGLIFFSMIFVNIFMSAYYHITYIEDYIYISGELLLPKERTQFKDLIEYKDISDIGIIIDTKNSKGKHFSWNIPSRNTPRTYFEFILNNGKRKRMYIMFFSKRQRIKMLEIINEKCNLNKDYMTMYNEHK